MTGDQFEDRIKAHYDAIDPGPVPARLGERVAAALVAAPSPRLGRWSRPLLATAGIAAVALVVIGAIQLSVATRGEKGPGGSIAPRPTPSGLASPPAQAFPTAVDIAGTTPAGGIWAVRGSTLLQSADAGTTWRQSSIPVTAGFPVTAYVLDASHAWSVTPGPGSTPLSGAPTDELRLVVHRTSDGGRTWDGVTVFGNYAGTTPAIAFIDQRTGFLFASAVRHSSGTSSVLRTDDGGQSWTLVGTGRWLGSVFAVGGGPTLWSGAENEAGPVSHPLLAVSRDGGRTWANSSLPGLEGQPGGGEAWLDGPPAFVGQSRGFLSISLVLADGSPVTRVFRTDDAGVSWHPAGTFRGEAFGGPAASDATHVLLPLSTLTATADGGTSWDVVEANGLPDAVPVTWIGFVDPRHGAARAGGLFLTSDGGRSWHAASIGVAP